MNEFCKFQYMFVQNNTIKSIFIKREKHYYFFFVRYSRPCFSLFIDIIIHLDHFVDVFIWLGPS